MESDQHELSIQDLATEIENLRKRLASKTIQYSHECLIKEHLDYLDLGEPE